MLHNVSQSLLESSRHSRSRKYASRSLFAPAEGQGQLPGACCDNKLMSRFNIEFAGPSCFRGLATAPKTIQTVVYPGGRVLPVSHRRVTSSHEVLPQLPSSTLCDLRGHGDWRTDKLWTSCQCCTLPRGSFCHISFLSALLVDASMQQRALLHSLLRRRIKSAHGQKNASQAKWLPAVNANFGFIWRCFQIQSQALGSDFVRFRRVFSLPDPPELGLAAGGTALRGGRQARQSRCRGHCRQGLRLLG